MSKLQHSILLLVTLGLVTLFYNLFDKEIALYFINRYDAYNDIGKLISKAGESHWYMLIGLFGFLYYRYKRYNMLYASRYLFLLYVNLFSGIISILLKTFFARVRPWGLEDGTDRFGFLFFQNNSMSFIEKLQYYADQMIHHPGLYASFPSGHTITVMAVATYMSLFFSKYIPLWYALALVVASGRLLAADHYPSDIIAGTYIGVVSTLFLYSKMKSRL